MNGWDFSTWYTGVKYWKTPSATIPLILPYIGMHAVILREIYMI